MLLNGSKLLHLDGGLHLFGQLCIKLTLERCQLVSALSDLFKGARRLVLSCRLLGSGSFTFLLGWRLVQDRFLLGKLFELSLESGQLGLQGICALALVILLLESWPELLAGKAQR